MLRIDALKPRFFEERLADSIYEYRGRMLVSKMPVELCSLASVPSVIA